MNQAKFILGHILASVQQAEPDDQIYRKLMSLEARETQKTMDEKIGENECSPGNFENLIKPSPFKKVSNKRDTERVKPRFSSPQVNKKFIPIISDATGTASATGTGLTEDQASGNLRTYRSRTLSSSKSLVSSAGEGRSHRGTGILKKGTKSRFARDRTTSFVSEGSNNSRVSFANE